MNQGSFRPIDVKSCCVGPESIPAPISATLARPFSTATPATASTSPA